MIQISDLYKRYGRGSSAVMALKDINLSVGQGELAAIMGPSGSGKSTLMNIIGCLDRPTQGDFLLNGQAVNDLDDHQLAVFRNQHIGFVFQNFNLLSRSTALANVELPMIYARVPARKRRKIAMELLEVVGLKDRIKHKPSELSGGQKQRVAIARAMVNHPSILLADEPTGNLDSRSGQDIIKLFETMNSIGVTVLLVTHDREVARHARRIIQFRDGRVVKDSDIGGPVKRPKWLPDDMPETIKL